MKLLWLTRGRDWGLRFVRDGGESDPLPVYEAAFASLLDERKGIERSAAGAALRFPDPLGRADHSGRPIVHDVLVYPPDSTSITSFEQGVEFVWPLIAEEYAHLYDLPREPRR